MPEWEQRGFRLEILTLILKAIAKKLASLLLVRLFRNRKELLCRFALWFRVRIIRKPRVRFIELELNGNVNINYEGGKRKTLPSEDDLDEERTRMRRLRCRIFGHKFVKYHKTYIAASKTFALPPQVRNICRVCFCEE